MDAQAERALRDALAFADSIIDTMHDSLLVLDAGLRVVRANREFYQAFAVSPEETVGRLVYELGNRQWDVPRLRTLLEEILPQNSTFRDFEVEHDFARVGRKVMLLNARRLYRESNHSAQILLVIEDATERRDAEEARRQAESRFTEMVKNVRDHSIFLTDPEGFITSWNVAAERIIGYGEAEALGKHFSLVFTHEDVREGLPERELRLAREAGRAEDERWHLRKDGTHFWALGIVTPLRDLAGRLTGFSKILRDMTERKQAEEALRRSEQVFRTLGEALPDLLWMADDRGRPIYQNPAWRRYTGLSNEDLARQGWQAAVHPDDLTRLSAAWDEANRHGLAFQVEHRFRRHDGAYRWFLSRTVPVKDSEGHVVRWVGTKADVHDRLQTQDLLRQSEERFRLMVLAVKDYAIFMMDPAGDVSTWNEGAQRILGYAGDEILGRSGSVFFTPEDLSEGLFERELRTAATQGRATDENWAVRKDGSRFWASGVSTALRGDGGELRGFVKILRDLTEQKRTEDRLRESEGRLRVALMAAEMGTWLWRIPEDEQILDDGLARLMGLGQGGGAMNLERFLQVVHPEDCDAVREAFEHSLRDGSAFDVEFRVAWPDGSVRWLKDQGKVFAGPDGRPAFMAGACVDVTARRRGEEALLEAHSELEHRVEQRTAELKEAQGLALQAERLAAIGQMVAGLAHESRNALQRGQACLSILAHRLQDQPECLDLVERAQKAQDDLHRLYEDVREYAAPITLDWRACDLSQVWREAWEDLGPSRAGKRAVLREEIASPPRCEASPFHLRQVFRNLLDNSLSMTDEALEIVVRCEAGLAEGREVLRVTVRDNGPGFPAGQSHRAFQPFFTTKVRGTGLGLAICARIIEAHGGAIALGETEGAGASVVITLPRSRT